jgi:Bacterial Ig-like domain
VFGLSTALTGSERVRVRQTDKAGNMGMGSSAVTLVYETPAAPTLSLLTDSAGGTGTGTNADGITNVATVNVSGLESGAAWEYMVDGGGAWTAGTGTTFDLHSGSHTYNVRQTDMAGNTTSAVLASVTYTFNLDTTAAAPSVALATDSGTSATDKITKTSTLNVTGLEAGATWEYTLNGTTWQAGTGTTITGITGDGAKSVQVRETDTAGNTSSASTAYTFTLDTTVAAPSVALATDSGTSATDKITNTSTLNVTGLEAGATWQYSLDNGATWNAGTGTTITGITGDGAKSVIVQQTDSAGNASNASSAVSYTLDTTAPVITNIAADKASLNSGDTTLVTFTMNEPVSSFDISKVSQDSHGYFSNLTQLDSTHWSSVYHALLLKDGSSPTDAWTYSGSVGSGYGGWPFAFGGGGAFTGGLLSQAIHTTAGKVYTVSFQFQSTIPGQAESVIASAKSSTGTTINSLLVTSTNNDSGWYAYQFTATDAVTNIEFYGAQDQPGADGLLASVSVAGHAPVTFNASVGTVFDLAGNSNLQHQSHAIL